MVTISFSSQRVGHYQVTAISDGTMQASLELLSGIDLPAAEKIQSQSGITVPGDIHIYCYLIRGAGRTILIDSGRGAVGELQRNLQALGVTPESIDTLLLTHAHPDHIGGLLNEAGQPAFINAQLYVHPAEAAFWLGDGQHTGNERTQRNALLVRRALEAYRPTLRLIEEPAITPDIQAVSLPGHTPGHTGYLIHSDNESVLIWGDIVHYPHIQLARPEVSIVFDHDPVLAEATRKAIVEQVFRDKTLVAGMHFGESAFGYIERDSTTGYVLRGQPQDASR
ncbi:MBL fold metallo-hydrolase [Type-D symbiont of Plautia stali]|uniref:MBL fold metallo-hydrolase n=1 Tax=Type-D symbiont of Plautia stali TaxID=1560356 RepID=UPI00128F004E|nr:MBL fold metallo-hydrolase [Type-D symbiont of Plautia stali]